MFNASPSPIHPFRSRIGVGPRPVAWILPLAAALLVVGLFAGDADAQVRSLTWSQVTTIEMPGALGTALRVSGALDERRSDHGMHLHGSILRQDDGTTSVIYDAENRRFVSVDHDQETYIEFTMEESAQLAREMSEVITEARAGADEAMQEAQAERDEALEELRRSMDAMENAMTFSVRTEATGERRRIGEMNAERFFITAELEAEDGVEGMEDAAGGQIVFLVDLWQTPDFPDLDAFMEEWAQQMASDPAMQQLANDLAESVEPVTGDSSAELLAVWDPRIAAGVKQIMEAMEGLEGTTLESRTLVAVVEPGARLDRAELLAWEPASMGDQLRGQAGDAARGAARDAARSAVGGLTRGLFGRGRGAAEEEEEARTPEVRPLLRITSVKENPLYSTDISSAQNPLAELGSYRPISLSELMGRVPPAN